VEPGSAVRPPAPVLRPFVSHYAGFCAHGLTPGTHAGVPSRHAHLIISLAAPFEVVRMPNATQRAARFTALVAGLQDAPATVRRDTHWEGLHVFLHPLGVQAILGVPGEEVASRVFDLADVWGSRSSRLVERLSALHTWNSRFALLDDELTRALGATSCDRAVTWAWRRLAASHGRGSIERLARDIGWSRRHLTERFRVQLGIAPKTAARIFRFERACRVIRDERPRLADVAAACGYHDQPHMTREWNALAGCSPREWMATELPFLQDYELGAVDHSGVRHPDDHDSADLAFVRRTV
jgi:AraC-like DNA-binding protein